MIRMNRDTLYSFLVADISSGATLTIPDSGGRYLSVMAVNRDHYINRVFHEAGEHELTTAEFDTPYVLVAVRILVDPADPKDIAAVNALQDGLEFSAGSAEPFSSPEYDETSLNATRQALLELGRGLSRFDHAFGTKDAVDPVKHLIATAGGWGGLPEQEAFYLNVDLGLPVGEYQLTVRTCRWMPSGPSRSTTPTATSSRTTATRTPVNSITASPNDDRSVTISFGGCDGDRPNCLPIMEGWNYAVRLYRPRPEILSGSWTFPSPEAA